MCTEGNVCTFNPLLCKCVAYLNVYSHVKWKYTYVCIGVLTRWERTEESR
jgi:hypothetical protein